MPELFKGDMRQKLIGERLKKAREEAGMSQEELGRLYGVRNPTITNLEKGRTKIDMGRLEVLAGILGKSVDWFLSDQVEDVHRPPHAALMELDYWADAHLPLYNSLHGYGDQKLVGFVSMYDPPPRKDHLRAYSIDGLDHPPDIMPGDIIIVDLQMEPKTGDLVICETTSGPIIDVWPTECRRHGVVVQQVRVRRHKTS